MLLLHLEERAIAKEEPQPLLHTLHTHRTTSITAPSAAPSLQLQLDFLEEEQHRFSKMLRLLSFVAVVAVAFGYVTVPMQKHELTRERMVANSIIRAQR